MPLRWLREADLDPDEFLAAPRFTPALGDVVRRVLATADTFYRRATNGIAMLPRGCRPGIGAAQLLYAEIGREVARRGYDSVSHRAVVTRRRKLWLLARAMTAPMPRGVATPPVDAARYLIQAVTEMPFRPTVRATTACRPGPIEQRVVWLCDLFERLERRRRVPLSGR